MNKAVPAKQNSRAKIGASRPFACDKQRLSDKTIVHYSLLIAHLAACGGGSCAEAAAGSCAGRAESAEESLL
jgi:hypothetical protein